MRLSQLKHLRMVGLIATTTLLFHPSAFAADAKITIPSAVPFSDSASVPQAVRDECELGEKVSSFLDRYASNVQVSDTHSGGPYIDMAITEVYAPGGGAFSGPKWMEVTGTLMDNN